MAVYVCGDTHGTHDIKKIIEWKPASDYISEVHDNVLIQLGDWAGLWYTKGNIKGYKKDRQELTKWIKRMNARDCQLIVVPGNHENWDMIEELPTVEMYGGKMYELKVYHHFHNAYLGTIYITQRGELYNIQGKTFWSFGGALSIDKDHRIPGESYWEQELASWYEYEYGMKKLDSVNWNVDYVITHTCPVNIIGDILHKTPYTEGKFKDPTAEYFFEIYKKLTFKEWFAGHFHVDVRLDYSSTNDGIFHICYNKPPKKLDV